MMTSEQQNAGRFRFGYSLFNQRKLKEALDQFNYSKTGGGQYGPASGYYAGFIEYGLGDFDGALVDLLRAEQNPPIQDCTLPHRQRALQTKGL